MISRQAFEKKAMFKFCQRFHRYLAKDPEMNFLFESGYTSPLAVLDNRYGWNDEDVDDSRQRM